MELSGDVLAPFSTLSTTLSGESRLDNQAGPFTLEFPDNVAPGLAMSTILIISLDTPYPDNYGGTKDIWQRLLLLKRAGHTLHLLACCKDERRHQIFADHERGQAMFASVLVLPTRGLASVLSVYPFGVASRKLKPTQVAVVAKAFGGIAFDAVEIEGLQALLTFQSVRRVIQFKRSYVRAFNRESAYQYNLARAEVKILHKIVYYLDALKFWFFERYGRWAKVVDAILFISSDEIGHRNFRRVRRQLLISPVFAQVAPKALADDFASRDNLFLYVGNLRLKDNEMAARMAFQVLRPMLEQHHWKFMICGLCDDPSLLADLCQHPLVEAQFNVTPQDLALLYRRSKIFACFSTNQAGVKLKLIEALQMGLPIFANHEAVAGSQLENAVILWRGDPAGVEPMLEATMQSAKSWQEQRSKGYSQWHELNTASGDNYLQLFAPGLSGG